MRARYRSSGTLRQFPLKEVVLRGFVMAKKNLGSRNSFLNFLQGSTHSKYYWLWQIWTGLDKKFSKWLYLWQNAVRDNFDGSKSLQSDFGTQKTCFAGFRLMSSILVFFFSSNPEFCRKSIVCSPKPTFFCRIFAILNRGLWFHMKTVIWEWLWG